MRSFKSNENIHKKEGGSYYVVSANKACVYCFSVNVLFQNSYDLVPSFVLVFGIFSVCLENRINFMYTCYIHHIILYPI